MGPDVNVCYKGWRLKPGTNFKEVAIVDGVTGTLCDPNDVAPGCTFKTMFEAEILPDLESNGAEQTGAKRKRNRARKVFVWKNNTQNNIL